MFRGCYFEYNGISSERYDLKLYYINNDMKNFDSGGSFELKTDNLPYSYEQIYYGKDYSASPLEFDVEIATESGNLTKERMAEIKNWLFGQNGWKDLSITDDSKNYHLKCIFEPNEDITDVIGYRGLRCKIRNISPFWYGDEKEISVTGLASNGVLMGGMWYQPVSIEIPNNDYADFIINPILEIAVDKTGDGGSNVDLFSIYSCNAESITDAQSLTSNVWTYPNTSELTFNMSFIGTKGNANSYDSLFVNTKYVTISSERYPSQQIFPIVSTSEPLPIFRLKYGTNICRIRYGWNFSSIKVKYTPVYRMGAF